MTRKKYIAEVRQDAGFALRLLRRTPGFTAVAIATLALGVGSTTAIFTIVDSVLLRPLRFPEPQRLTMIRPTSGSRVSAAYLHEWRLQGQTFQDMAGWQDVRANLTGRGEPLEVLVDRVTPNFFAVLFLGSFAAAALLLASIGLYGVIAFGVTQRTREIGVRVALGAQHRDVVRLVMQRGMLLIGGGLAIGIVASLAMGRMVAGLLYGVTPTDPMTLLAVTVFLAAVAMLATYLPARRATRVDPMLALKAE